jgi:hypothetical protein
MTNSSNIIYKEVIMRSIKKMHKIYKIKSKFNNKADQTIQFKIMITTMRIVAAKIVPTIIEKSL